jgi:hypothetical protein
MQLHRALSLAVSVAFVTTAGMGCGRVVVEGSGVQADTTGTGSAGTGSAGGIDTGGSGGIGTGGTGGMGTGGAGGIGTGGTGGVGTGGAGGIGTGGAGGGVVSCSNDDAYEDNDTAVTAAAVMQATQIMGWFQTSAWLDDLFLCNGDHDWYAIETAFGQAETHWHLRVLAAGAGHCGDPVWCGDYVPPPGPANTIYVEVYNATTMTLLDSGTDPSGLVWLDGNGPNAAQNLLIHIYGPAQAVYPYKLHFWAVDYDGEDECEC